VWRSYVTAARAGGAEVIEIRYEDVTADPAAVAAVLAPRLGAPVEPLIQALALAHASSVGRYRSDLDADQLAEVEAEAGPLLRELGYS
jgi:LPS sulfotransferase NodH